MTGSPAIHLVVSRVKLLEAELTPCQSLLKIF